MQRLLWRHFTLRHWGRSLRSTMMLVLLLALGVGVFLAVRLANRAAVAGFAMYTDTVMGTSDFVVQPKAGDLPEGVLPELRKALGPLPVGLFPVVQSYAIEVSESGQPERFTLLGVDVVAIQNAQYLLDDDALDRLDRSRRQSVERPAVNTDELSRPGRVIISQALATRRNLEVGDTIPVTIGDQFRTLTVALVAPDNELSASRPAELLVMDLPGLQRINSRTGRVDRVEVRVAAGQSLPEVQSLLQAAANGQSWSVETPDSQRATGETMTRAFRMNLTILSGLALLVGIYLIFQALEAAVVRRRPEIAVLRSLGVPAKTIQRSWLLESLTLGFVGSICGVMLGWLGAQLAVRAVALTVNMLYFQSTTSAASLHLGEVLFAVAFGLGASLLAGWIPARDAARTPPAQILQRGTWTEGMRSLSRPGWGLLLVLLGVGCCFLPGLPLRGGGQFPLAGYIGAILWVLGGSMLASQLFGPLGGLIKRLAPNSAVAAYAGSRLARPSGRHRMTVAGLLLAVGMAAGMGTLVHSFDITMRGWIGALLKADLYVSASGMQSVTTPSLISESAWRSLVDDVDIKQGEVGRMESIRLDGRPTYLNGVRLDGSESADNLLWIDKPDADVEFDTPGMALASECFCQRFDKRKGSTVRIPTPAGEREVTIAGVYADYGNEHGSLAVNGEHMAEWFSDQRVTSAALTVKDGVDVEAVARRFRAEYPGLGIRVTRSLRQEILQVFRQTFSITHALKGIGVVVAVLGLGLALFSLLVERRRELQTLKRLGLSRRRIALAAAIEGTGIAVVGTIAGLILSVALGALLVFVVNKQSFGWTLQFGVSAASMVMLAGLVLASSFLVSYAVGRWGATLPSDGEE